MAKYAVYTVSIRNDVFQKYFISYYYFYNFRFADSRYPTKELKKTLLNNPTIFFVCFGLKKNVLFLWKNKKKSVQM